MPCTPTGPPCRALALFLIALAAITSIAEAGEPRTTFDGVPVARLREVTDRCYNLEDDAAALIGRLRLDFPESLAPDVIVVTRLYWLQAYAQVDSDLTRRFEQEAVALLDRAQRHMRRRPSDPDAVVLAAVAHLTLGGYYAESERWWPAFWRVRAGRGLALRALRLAPDHAEAQMPLGVLECYLAQTPGYLKPLARMLGASGDFETGLERLRTARDEAIFTANEATFYLGQIEAELRRDPAAARAEIERLATRYPDNPFFQRMLGVLECRSGRREQGRARLQAVPDMERAREMPALAVRALMRLCWDCMSTGDYESALDAASRAAAIVDADAALTPLAAGPLLGRGEALKALGRIDEALACFAAVPDDDSQRDHALDRIRQIQREVDGRD